MINQQKNEKRVLNVTCNIKRIYLHKCSNPAQNATSYNKYCLEVDFWDLIDLIITVQIEISTDNWYANFSFSHFRYVRE
jgi:hypothetical protein